MENADLMTAVDAAEKYGIELEKILTAVQLRWLRFELAGGILFIHEKEFRQLLRHRKTEYIQTTFAGFGRAKNTYKKEAKKHE